MVTNDDGWVALKKYQTINQVVGVHGEEYLFNTQANICLAWVRPEDVPTILGIMKVCCGGSRKPMFQYANEDDVRRWSNGGGR